MRRISLLAALLFAVTGCSKSTGSTANDDCNPGEVAIDGECRTLCTVDGDCGNDEICNASSICETGARTDGPNITGIDGNGSPVTGDEVSRFATDPDNPGVGDLTGHHIQDALVVRGANLQGASFELQSSGAGSEPLTIVTPGDTEVTLALPTAIATGNYLLVASNAAGSDQGTVYILRGEIGPAGADGSPDDAAAVLAKLLTVDGPGSALDADTVDGLDSSAFLLDATDVIDGSHITDGSITAADIDTTGLDADTVGGMSAAEITASALENRCFEVRHDNQSGGARATKIFDIPFDCISPYQSGRGCWGEMMTVRSGGVSSWTSPLRAHFINTSGATWYVQVSRGDASFTARDISASGQNLVNPTSDSGHCELRNANGSKNTTGDGYRNFNLSASAGSYCYLRLCETLLDSQQLP